MDRRKDKFLDSLDLKAMEQDMGLSYKELMHKYRLNYMQVYRALKAICGIMANRVLEPVPPSGSLSLCKTLRDIMPDIELLHREGVISDWQFLKYQKQATATTT